VICYVPKPTIAITGQKTFPTAELLTLPRCDIDEYTEWGDYVSVLERIMDSFICGKYTGPATSNCDIYRPSGLLRRWGTYDSWVPTDNHAARDSQYQRAAREPETTRLRYTCVCSLSDFAKRVLGFGLCCSIKASGLSLSSVSNLVPIGMVRAIVHSRQLSFCWNFGAALASCKSDGRQ
jgi:hypothetical protein